ncbi:MAG TPA: M48 family metallopeptidase [Gemmatimonadaceae bacterium]|jgi:Zn-dependent protease with chaperone function|nr:M48 family metallopeptidase [Gemmatimonadaceae bacterium]
MQSDSKSLRPVIVDPLVHPKEKIYFAICAVVSIAIYLVLARVVLSGAEAGGVILFYVIAGIIAVFLFHGVMLGQIRGNGIRVSDRQFPELMAMAIQHSRRLGMDETPDIFVLQSGGVLNAFATRFLGRNFVVLYSDVLALATQKGEKAVSFVLGHELGHVRRKHMTRRALLYPAMVFPFLGLAYSRACEYTCDSVGNALEPEGGVDGLLVLAAGRELYTQVNAAVYSDQRETETGFFVRFAEILSTHPNLTKRVAALAARRQREPSASRPINPDAAIAS